MHSKFLISIGNITFLFSLFLFACNPGSGNNTNNTFNNTNNTTNNVNVSDKDHDGYSPLDGDCDDDDPNIHPGVQEVPDGIDNDCDGFVDDDYDHDGYGSASGDCDDHDPSVNPMQVEICDDGVDNDCNGYTDMEEPDKDGDGFSPCEGDCNDNEILIGPASIEVIGDNVDNDCDGAVDIISPPCDCHRSEITNQLMNMGENASIATALGICNTSILDQTIQVLGAQSYAIVSYDASGITPNADGWGSLIPIPPRKINDDDPDLPTSCQMLALFTGIPFNPAPQSDNMDLEYTCSADPVTYIDNPEPDDQPATCTDLTQVKLILRVPGNANGFSFDFIYLSAEYPEYVGTEFNDTFYAILGKTDADATHINVSFDGNGKAITINNNFFLNPPVPIITGTHYDDSDGGGGSVGSATGWLTTSAPVEPGSTVELIFSIHDEGDYILDSAVVIDNFRWTTKDIEGPTTVQ